MARPGLFRAASSTQRTSPVRFQVQLKEERLSNVSRITRRPFQHQPTSAIMLSQSLMRASVCHSLLELCARDRPANHLFPQRQSLVRVARQQTMRRTFAVSAVVKGTLASPTE